MRRIPPMAIAALFRHLAGAQRGGLPLQDALAILSRDADLGRAQAALISDLADQLSRGRPFSVALEAHPTSFARETVELLRAAESASALADALELLAADHEQRAAQRAAVRGVLAWPAAIVVVLVVLLFVLALFVLPVFKTAFTSYGAEIPGLTLLLIVFLDAVAGHWYWGVLAGVVAFLLRDRLPGRAWIDRALLRLPVLRSYLVKTFVARASRAISAATQGRLPLAAALSYVRATTGNLRLAASAQALESEVRAGKNLLDAVRSSSAFPGQLAVALEIGERSNNLGPALHQLVAFTEGDAAKSLVRLQQAALVATYVCLGCIVAFLVISIYLPIFVVGAS